MKNESTSMSMGPSAADSTRQIIGDFFSRDTLKARVFRGGAWLGAGSFSEQVFRFGRNMILTRVLAPEAFGTMAIILSSASIIQSLTEVGAKEALIQNPNGDQEEHIGAAWWLAFGRSASVYLMLFMAAPFMARFYGNLQLTALLRVATLGLIFEGAISTKAYVAMKQMKFSRWAIINHGGAILGVVTTLVLSFYLRNIWALVLGACSESVAKCILSYIVCPYLPPFGWHAGAIRDLLHFSRGVFGLPFLNLIFIRADIFVLAKLYSPAELGVYAMAVYLVQTPASFLMNLLGQTLLPAFSQVQTDNDRTKRMLVQTTSVLLLAGMPAVVFVFFCGHSVLTLAYGQRYGSAVLPLIVAAFVALLNVVNGQITMIFYARGLPQLHRRCVVIMAITITVLIYPFVTWFGLVGAQLAALIAVGAGLLFQVLRARDLIALDLSVYSRVFLLAAAVSSGTALLCLGTRPFASLAQPIPNTLFGVLGCVIAYVLSARVFLRGNSKEMVG
jgi:O-antigen/teichoic acid export membrane protein